MMALVKAARTPGYPASINLVVSNNPAAEGLGKAANAGIHAVCLDHRTFGQDREAFERRLDETLGHHGVQFIALAGFMRVLTPWFVTQWRGRMINIHPSLLPKYKGLHTHARAIAAGDPEHGCTVHWVVPELDAGETIAQARVPVLANDNPDTLAARVLQQEHRLYPLALALAVRSVAGSLNVQQR